MQIQDIMTRDVRMTHPDEALREAARMMVDADVGAIPVGENDRLVGILTDRDIVTRAVAEGLAPAECRVRDAMSRDIKYVYQDEDVEEVARNMERLQVRRLPVLDREKRLVGIVAMADLATAAGTELAGRAIEGVSRP